MKLSLPRGMNRSCDWPLVVCLIVLKELGTAHADKVSDEYTEYVKFQRGKTDWLSRHGQTATQWVKRDQIAKIVQHVRSHVDLVKHFALCHGTRSGRENLWFRELLGEVQTWGTELSPIAAMSSPWTIPWDFHKVRPEWKGAADFVYTNALDHSYNPSMAVSRWMSEVHSGGALYVQWSNIHEHTVPDKVDIFGASHEGLVRLLCDAGPFAVSLLPLPLDKMNNHRAYVVRHNKTLPGGSSSSNANGAGRGGSEADLCASGRTTTSLRTRAKTKKPAKAQRRGTGSEARGKRA